MATSSPTPDPAPLPTAPEAERTLLGEVQRRIIGGLILALPIVITFWIIYWLYTTLQSLVLKPIAAAVTYLLGSQVAAAPPWWWDSLVAPAIGIIVVLCVLYVLGLFVHSRVSLAISWIMLRVPVVTTIYKTVNQVFTTMAPQQRGNQFKRVVLVEFPQPGMRSLGLVTNSLRDATTQKTILSVCVLTGVMPPTGFTLFVPEESVTDIEWTVNQTLQAIVSGGITAPDSIHYFPDAHTLAQRNVGRSG